MAELVDARHSKVRRVHGINSLVRIPRGAMCGRGGTGRRASFKNLFPKRSVGSSPTALTKLTGHKGKYFRSWGWADVFACAADANDPDQPFAPALNCNRQRPQLDSSPFSRSLVASNPQPADVRSIERPERAPIGVPGGTPPSIAWWQTRVGSSLA